MHGSVHTQAADIYRTSRGLTSLLVEFGHLVAADVALGFQEEKRIGVSRWEKWGVVFE